MVCLQNYQHKEVNKMTIWMGIIVWETITNVILMHSWLGRFVVVVSSSHQSPS